MWPRIDAHLFRLCTDNRAEMGERYGRQCESVRMAQIIMQTALRKRGTLNMSFGRVNCDYAGGFGAYKIENGM